MGGSNTTDSSIGLNFLKASFNSIPEAIVLADSNREIIGVNTYFEEIFGFNEKDILGKKTLVLYKSEQDFLQAGKTKFNPGSSIESVEYEVDYIRKSGEIFPGKTVGSIVKNKHDEVVGYLGIIRDLSAEKERESKLEKLSNRIELLIQIITRNEGDYGEQIYQSLKLTTEMLDFDVGIVSQIDEDTYTVKHCYPESEDLTKGMQFDLGVTYCSITYESNRIVAIDDMLTSRHKEHPCFENFNLRTYIGIPLAVNGERYGTLNFSSPKSRSESFHENDKNFLRLLGDWVSSVIERQQIKQDLIDSRERYRLISEETADMLCLHSPDGTYEYVTPSVKNILGYTPEELIGTSPYRLFHKDDLKKIEEQSHKKAKHGEQIKSIQYRIRKKDGKYIWFETSTEPILDDDGHVKKLQTASRDITERKRLELILKETNKLATVGGWEYELETGELIWTDEVFRIHELPIGEEPSVDEAVNFYAPEDKYIIDDALETAINEGKGYDVELTLITANGNRKWVRAIGKTQKKENGEVYKLFGVFQDLTTRKEIEEKLVNQNNRLKRLMKSSNEINSVIGHDLKNPLTSIIGLSELMVSEKDDMGDVVPEDWGEYVSLIYQTSMNMSRLLDDLLNWALMQTGEIQLNISKFSLDDLVGEVASFLKTVAKQKGIKIVNKCDKGIELSADRMIVKTVLQNFVSNAVKFSDNGDEITIECQKKPKSWIISVRDEGTGMSEEVKSNLFDPENHPSTYGTNNEKGTGIGLRLCYELVEIHNGEIEVESELGKGSEFSLIIPQ